MQLATVHITEVSDGKPQPVHLCQKCASKGGFVGGPMQMPEGLREAVERAKQIIINRTGYLTLPRADGVEFHLPGVRPTARQLLLPLIYFVVQSGLFFVFVYSMKNFGLQGAIWGKIVFVPFLAMIPLANGATQQLFTQAVNIRVKGARLVVPRYPAVKTRGKGPVEVPLATIARFELDLPPAWQVRIGYRTPRLLAEHFGGDRTVIAMNRPPQLLENLAEDLRRATQQERVDAAVETEAEVESVTVADVSEIPAIERDVVRKPYESKIRYVQEGELHTFYLPSAGLFRNRIFLLLYGSITLIPLLILGPIVFRGLMAPAKWLPGAGPIVASGVVVVVAALVALVVGIHFWSKKYVVVVRANGKEPGSLTCVGKGVFGGREIVMERGNLRGVTTRRSRFLRAMHIEEPQPQAVLFLTDLHGKKRVLVSGEELEMRWLATRVRELLEVPRR